MQHAFSIKANAAWRKWRNNIVKIFAKGWFTLVTEATEAESESEESSDLVLIGTTEATEVEAESEEKETLLILLTPILSSFRLRFRLRF